MRCWQRPARGHVQPFKYNRSARRRVNRLSEDLPAVRTIPGNEGGVFIGPSPSPILQGPLDAANYICIASVATT